MQPSGHHNKSGEFLCQMQIHRICADLISQMKVDGLDEPWLELSCHAMHTHRQLSPRGTMART